MMRRKSYAIGAAVAASGNENPVDFLDQFDATENTLSPMESLPKYEKYVEDEDENEDEGEELSAYSVESVYLQFVNSLIGSQRGEERPLKLTYAAIYTAWTIIFLVIIKLFSREWVFAALLLPAFDIPMPRVALYCAFLSVFYVHAKPVDAITLLYTVFCLKNRLLLPVTKILPLTKPQAFAVSAFLHWVLRLSLDWDKLDGNTRNALQKTVYLLAFWAIFTILGPAWGLNLRVIGTDLEPLDPVERRTGLQSPVYENMGGLYRRPSAFGVPFPSMPKPPTYEDPIPSRSRPFPYDSTSFYESLPRSTASPHPPPPYARTWQEALFSSLDDLKKTLSLIQAEFMEAFWIAHLRLFVLYTVYRLFCFLTRNCEPKLWDLSLLDWLSPWRWDKVIPTMYEQVRWRLEGLMEYLWQWMMVWSGNWNALGPVVLGVKRNVTGY